MNFLTTLIVIGLVPLANGLNCYFCIGGTSGCNDPFSPTSGTVNTTSNMAFTHCTKILTGGVVTRSGTIGCIESPIVLNSGVKCCNTDLCNGAQNNLRNSMLIFLSLSLLFWNIY